MLLCIVLILLLVAPLHAQEALLSHPDVRTALQHIEKNYDRYLQKQIQIAEIPAPPFKEFKRAQFMADEFRRMRLTDVHIDTEGNVLGWRRGRTSRTLAISAHLDTVFPDGTDVTVKQNGSRYLGPGLSDDSIGLMSLLALMEALDYANIRTDHTLLFVATVGEEGLGDLRGVKYLFLKSAYRDSISAFISIDGADPSLITNGALGSKRYRITITGPGGHSYEDFGQVNPAHALGQIIARFTMLGLPSNPKTTYNVGRIGGGTSVNAIPAEAWLEVDMRSESDAHLQTLEQIFLKTVEQGVSAENLFRVSSNSRLEVKTECIGDRPSGVTSSSAALVQAAQWAIGALGLTSHLETYSTDANIPISLNIPAIAVGGGGKEGNNHSLNEWFEPEGAYKGIQKNLLLILAYDQLTPSQH